MGPRRDRLPCRGKHIGEPLAIVACLRCGAVEQRVDVDVAVAELLDQVEHTLRLCRRSAQVVDDGCDRVGTARLGEAAKLDRERSLVLSAQLAHLATQLAQLRSQGGDLGFERGGGELRGEVLAVTEGPLELEETRHVAPTVRVVDVLHDLGALGAKGIVRGLVRVVFAGQSKERRAHRRGALGLGGWRVIGWVSSVARVDGAFTYRSRRLQELVHAARGVSVRARQLHVAPDCLERGVN